MATVNSDAINIGVHVLFKLWLSPDTCPRMGLLDYMGFLVAQLVKNLPGSAGNMGSIPGLGRSPGEGNGNPLQYPCLEHLMDREAWWVAVRGLTKSRHN